MSYSIRALHDTDLPQLTSIYRSSIREQGAQYYSTAQITAWSGFADDTEGFTDWVCNAHTIIATDIQHSVLGFASLQPHGRISALFVAPRAMRRGIGNALVRQLIDTAVHAGLAELTTEASEFSRPVFERCGFTLGYIEHTTVRGVAFSRYVMALRLA